MRMDAAVADEADEVEAGAFGFGFGEGFDEDGAGVELAV